MFLVSTFERDAWICNAQAGYARNENRVDERRDVFQVSSSVVYRVNPQWQCALDLSAISNVDTANSTFPAEALVAVIYSPVDYVDLDVGVKFGLNGAADDYALLAGVTIRW